MTDEKEPLPHGIKPVKEPEETETKSHKEVLAEQEQGLAGHYTNIISRAGLA